MTEADHIKEFGKRWGLSDPEGWLESCSESFDSLEQQGEIPLDWVWTQERVKNFFPLWMDAALVLGKYRALDLLLKNVGITGPDLTLKERISMYHLTRGDEL